jgi:hypothetical protein
MFKTQKTIYHAPVVWIRGRYKGQTFPLASTCHHRLWICSVRSSPCRNLWPWPPSWGLLLPCSIHCPFEGFAGFFSVRTSTKQGSGC